MIIQQSTAGGGKNASDWLASQGFAAEPVVDGRIHRGQHSCSPAASDDAGWYWVDLEPYAHGACGCWRCGHRANWTTVGETSLTEEQRREMRARIAAREAEIEADQQTVSERLTALRRELEFAPDDHPYLVAKGIKPHGALIHAGNLILPLVDIDGRIWSAQGISEAPRADWGGRNKSFEKGGRIAGCFFPIGNVREAEKVLVTEGFATGATLHEATGLPVACAMSAGNLKAVAAAIRKNNPASAVIICADNDRHTAGNPGVTKAEEVALSLSCAIAVPDFGDVPPGPSASDFNDLARIRGIDAVREAIAAVTPPERPPLVYDAGRMTWWIKVQSGEFISVSEGGARRRLKANSYDDTRPKGAFISPLESELVRLTHEDNVTYAGPVAGWPVGVHRMAGRRVLVTSASTPAPRGPGEGTVILDIFRRMLGDDQARRFLLWLLCARRRLQTRRWHPMPAIAFVGPKSCGKSFAQFIITKMLGERSAKPAQYLQGVTQFNGDLLGAEHLVFEDESAKCDGPSRRHLGEQIKTMLFCRQIQCHAKHRQAITLEPFWALSLSVNDEAEHMMVLPTIDDSLADKILLLRCESHPRPVPDGMEETDWLTRLAEVEVPMIADMLDRLTPDDFPDSMRNPRTIVAGWQNAEIMGMISDLSPEAMLLNFIDQTLFTSSIPSPWTGSAVELSTELRKGPVGAESAKLLSWPTACGVYLARLANQQGNRVTKHEHRSRGDGRAVKWTISPPAE